MTYVTAPAADTHAECMCVHMNKTDFTFTFQRPSMVPKLEKRQHSVTATAERCLVPDTQVTIADILLCVRNPMTGLTTSRLLK